MNNVNQCFQYCNIVVEEIHSLVTCCVRITTVCVSHVIYTCVLIQSVSIVDYNGQMMRNSNSIFSQRDLSITQLQHTIAPWIRSMWIVWWFRYWRIKKEEKWKPKYVNELKRRSTKFNSIRGKRERWTRRKKKPEATDKSYRKTRKTAKIEWNKEGNERTHINDPTQHQKYVKWKCIWM